MEMKACKGVGDGVGDEGGEDWEIMRIVKLKARRYPRAHATLLTQASISQCITFPPFYHEIPVFPLGKDCGNGVSAQHISHSSHRLLQCSRDKYV